MQVKYTYKKFEKFYRPVIPVSLRLNKIVLKYEALIDSGSDICIFHKELGELLGLDFNKLEIVSFKGISSFGATIGYQAAIEIGLENTFYNSVVIFSDKISPSGYGIVGQRGFFEFFKIRFDLSQKIIELKSVK